MTQIGWSREDMAQRAALDIGNGAYVNLGIGIPELVAKYVPEGREVIYHTENGLLGMGPAPQPGNEDPELINAGKRQVKDAKKGIAQSWRGIPTGSGAAAVFEGV